MILARRNFLRQLLVASAAVGAAAIDPELLVWVPRQLVAVTSTYETRLCDINAVARLHILAPLSDQYFRSDPFLRALSRPGLVRVTGKPIEAPLVFR